jgi:hypothetical protein
MTNPTVNLPNDLPSPLSSLNTQRIPTMEADLEKKAEPSPENSLNQEYGHVLTQTHDKHLFTRIIDSFRQNPNARFSPILVDDDGKPLKDQPPAQPPLAMKLKERHLQMIAIGGSIGTCAIPPSDPKCSIFLKYYFASIGLL